MLIFLLVEWLRTTKKIARTNEAQDASFAKHFSSGHTIQKKTAFKTCFKNRGREGSKSEKNENQRKINSKRVWYPAHESAGAAVSLSARLHASETDYVSTVKNDVNVLRLRI